MKSSATKSFRKRLNALPALVQEQVATAYALTPMGVGRWVTCQDLRAFVPSSGQSIVINLQQASLRFLRSNS
ncbi:hypothetical protein QUA20_29925 [Microcoleus sp. Pol7_A1]|uniref:hypothetical protein n=1 Tax=Microcoleus sp. Pol7_A1 TaxID=2818893 RepID=UPI002FCFB24F